ncbi:MAG: HAD family hydrolase [Canibacter sp.]
MKTPPKAVLLDFGGVIVTTSKRNNWHSILSDEVYKLLSSERAVFEELNTERIESDLIAAAKADSYWKNSTSRKYAPLEMTYVEFWRDYVAADWPAPAQNVVVSKAQDLCRVLGQIREERIIRPGIVEFLELCLERSISLGIVSNSLMGDVHREYLAENRLEHFFAVQIYSDEIGARKPNPEMINRAAEDLRVSPRDSWYVGDNFDRDVLCGARAGIGMNILIEAEKTYELPFPILPKPDMTVKDPHGLTELLKRHL